MYSLSVSSDLAEMQARLWHISFFGPLFHITIRGVKKFAELLDSNHLPPIRARPENLDGLGFVCPGTGRVHKPTAKITM